MPTQVQFRRGTDTQTNSFTGAAGEITINLTNDTIHVHDGSTVGGFELARADLSNASGTTVSAGTGITKVGTTLSIGQDVATTANVTFNNVDVDGTLTIGGTTTTSGSIIPDADVSYDLGSALYQWRDVYVGPGSLYVNGQKVLEDSLGTIVVSADIDQNLQMKTAGSGDIEFNPSGTGIVQVKGTLQMLDGQNITNSAGNAVAFGSGLASDSLASVSTNTDLTLSGNGTGNVVVSDSLTVSGNLTVSGTTTTVNSETISLADNLIDLNSNFTSGSPTEDAGIRIMRGDSSNTQLRWNETSDQWEFTNDGSSYVKISTDTDDLSEGLTNQYFTNTRSREAISVSGAGLGYDATTGVITISNVPTSNVDGLDTALGLKAPLASPDLTGSPTAPTAATGTNTTQIASTAFVQQELDALRAELYAYDAS